MELKEPLGSTSHQQEGTLIYTNKTKSDTEMIAKVRRERRTITSFVIVNVASYTMK